MKYTQNLHTHTVYCDGKNTPEEIIKKAIELGFDTIGLSGHSPIKIDLDYFISDRDIPKYKEEIFKLKSKYKDQITVLCGIEYDMFSHTSQNGYDYIIGSNHHLMIDGKITDIDQPVDKLSKIIEEHFGGSWTEYAKAYYETTAKIPQKVNADFIAHIDLITKHCDRFPLIDTNHKEYKTAAIDAVREISKKINVFEVNTGAISRGYRSTPYPAPFILEEINRLGGHVIVTSDCHNMEFLDCKFDYAIELIKSCGFKEIYRMTNNSFEGISLKQI